MMIRFHLCITVFLLVFLWTNAQTWQPLGSTITSQPYEKFATGGKIAIDSHGTPYITFYDHNSDYRPAAVKFNGYSWEPVGDPMPAYIFTNAGIALHPDDTPYIVYDERDVIARKFNGRDWEPVGTYEERTWGKVIAFDTAGTPYVAYSFAVNMQANDYKIKVLKLVDNHWVTVGGESFGNGRGNIQLVISPDGMPWVASTEFPGYKGVVWKFNGSGWERAGTPESLEGVSYPTLAFAPDGTPYIAYRSMDYKQVTVKKLNGKNWEIVGNRIFPSNHILPDIAIDPAGTPYLAYADNLNANKLTVVRYDGTTWEIVGDAAFSDTKISNISMAMDQAGTPYIAYSDQYNGFDYTNYRLRVVKLVDDNWISLGGTGITGGLAGIRSATTDPNGWIYLVYSFEGAFTLSGSWHKTRVIRYDGKSWQKLGNNHFWKGLQNEQIAVGPDGIPYIAYSDSANDGRVTVERYINNKWETVGSEGFSGIYAVATIAIGSDNMPYVAYSEGTERMTYVKRFNGSEWEDVGTPVIEARAATPFIAMDKAGTPYVAYADLADNRSIIVKKFNGHSWETLGNEVASGREYNIFMTIDPTGTPYVLYENWPVGITPTIKKFNGTGWETLNNAGIPPKFYADHLVLDTAGIPYIAYQNIINKNNSPVIRYNGNKWEPFGNRDFSEVVAHQVRMLADNKGNFYMILNNNGLWVYQYLENCMNPTNGGLIGGDQTECSGFDPAPITSLALPEGHDGILEYRWQKSLTNSTSGFTDIKHYEESYDPGPINQTTWYKRLVRVNCLTEWTGAAESNVVEMTVIIPKIICPANDTINTDKGVSYAREIYRVKPDWIADSTVHYVIDGNVIKFPYDFPIGTTTVEVRANNTCITEALCSFTVTVLKPTKVEELKSAETEIKVHPNPFTYNVAIEIVNSGYNEISAELYNISGQKIKTLARARKEAKIILLWDGSNEQGLQVLPGIYFCKINGKVVKVVKR